MSGKQQDERVEPAAARRGRDGDRLELDQFIPYRLSVLQQEVSRAIAAVYAEQFDLMRYDWRVMAALGNNQPLSANGVCERTNMDKVQVSRAIARLLQKDLVIRTQDLEDRRRSSLRLSPRGETIYSQIVPAARAREAELLEVLEGDELAQLGRLISKLYQRARQLNRGRRRIP